MLNRQIAEKIRDKVAPLVNLKLSVADTQGQILASDHPDAGTKLELAGTHTVELVYGGQTVGLIAFAQELPPQTEPLIKSIAELLIHQSVLTEQLPDREERLDKFIYDLLHKAKADEALLLAEAQLFRIDLRKPKVVIAVYINDPELTPETRKIQDHEISVSRYKNSLRRALDSFYTTNRDHTVAYLGRNHFCILKSLGDGDPALAGTASGSAGGAGDLSENLETFKKSINSFYQIIKSELRTPCTFGIGNYYPKISGLRQSYQQALNAIEIGTGMWDEDRFYHIDDFGVVAPLLSGVDEHNIHFSRDLLEKLGQSSEMLKTLETFFALDMSLTRTAEQLNIHRNTLVYRLDRVAEALNLDPRNFDDAAQIQLAMLYPRFLTSTATGSNEE